MPGKEVITALYSLCLIQNSRYKFVCHFCEEMFSFGRTVLDKDVTLMDFYNEMEGIDSLVCF